MAGGVGASNEDHAHGHARTHAHTHTHTHTHIPARESSRPERCRAAPEQRRGAPKCRGPSWACGRRRRPPGACRHGQRRRHPPGLVGARVPRPRSQYRPRCPPRAPQAAPGQQRTTKSEIKKYMTQMGGWNTGKRSHQQSLQHYYKVTTTQVDRQARTSLREASTSLASTTMGGWERRAIAGSPPPPAPPPPTTAPFPPMYISLR